MLAMACVGVSRGADVPLQSEAGFKTAVRAHSTSPLYVAVTVVDDRTGIRRAVCTIVNAVAISVAVEHGWAPDRVGLSQAEQVMLSSADHVFHFSDPEALANLSALYTQHELASVRAELRAYSVEQLRQGFSATGSLHAVHGGERRYAYRDATACVLIERGLSPEVGDEDPAQIWLAQ